VATLFVPPRRPLTIGRELGSGAEGFVFAVAGSDDVCLKVYDEAADDLDRRLDAMLRSAPYGWGGDHPEHVHVTWPQAKVVDEHQRTRGFLMPRLDVSRHARLELLFDPGRRSELLEEPTWGQLLGIAGRIARLVAALHAEGVVVGDLSGSNIWVARSGHVTFIDCDSMQVRDPSTGHVFPARKNTPGYAPPEVVRGEAAAIGHEQDRFGLAVLVCQLLLEGDHPFEGVPTGPGTRDGRDATLEDNVVHQCNRITHAERLRPRAGDLPTALLPPEVRHLAEAAFGPGHTEPARRPTAAAWSDRLTAARANLTGCRTNPRHLYPPTLPACIWCARRQAGLGDHYPPAGPVWAPGAPWAAAAQAGAAWDGIGGPAAPAWPPAAGAGAAAGGGRRRRRARRRAAGTPAAAAAQAAAVGRPARVRHGTAAPLALVVVVIALVITAVVLALILVLGG
jgi:DNA-binding helix-hairpin-helix protein with protein kinase domain